MDPERFWLDNKDTEEEEVTEEIQPPVPDRTEAKTDRRTPVPPRYGYYNVQRQPVTGYEERDRIPIWKKAAVVVFLAALATFAVAVISVLRGSGMDPGRNSVETTVPVAEADSQVNVPADSASTAADTEASADPVRGAEDTVSASDTVPSAAVDDQQGSESMVYTGKGQVADVAASCMPSVVAITSVSIQEVSDFWGYRRQYEEGSGSGIIVGENDTELLIATNNHVIAGTAALQVFFYGDDGQDASSDAARNVYGLDTSKGVEAVVKGADEDNDLAVVAVQKSLIPADTMQKIRIAVLGSSDDLVVGEQVVAIGNALGYGQSVTSGWISAMNRTVVTEEGTASQLIQTDAAINPGNSGGALLNLNGEVVGINSAKYANYAVEGMGYAIPISKASPILDELMTRQTRTKLDKEDSGYLGVSLLNLSAKARQMYNMPAGAFVEETYEWSPASEAGIRRGDIIVKIDGQKVSDGSALLEKLLYYAPGETVDIVVTRVTDGEYKEMTISVTLGSRE